MERILVNAKESMSDTGVIKISLENILIETKGSLGLKQGHYIKISVKDEGDGIPEESLSSIFDLYFTTKDVANQKGTGLGLAICYSIVKNHEGTITTESEHGAGTTVHVYLPALKG